MEEVMKVGQEIEKTFGETETRSPTEQRTKAWKGRAEDVLSSGRDRLVGRFSRLADAIRRTGDQLQEEDESLARYLRTFADRVAETGSYLESREPREWVQEAEQIARRRPAAFVSGAAVLGFALARLMKGVAGGPTPTSASSS